MSAPGTEEKFDRLAIFGIGLLGSSLALAARRGGLARQIVAFDTDAGVRARARELGLADIVTDTAAEAAAGADLAVLCVPVGAMGPVAGAIGEHLPQGAIVTDTGSVKVSVIRDVAPHLPAGIHFIPSHPVAGTERSGPDAGFAEMFEGRWCLMTPIKGTDASQIDRLSAFWAGCEMKVDTMDAEHHDRVLAITSHLPHLIAYNIVGTAADLELVSKSEVVKYAASGFRDFTRLAASNPTMWRDVFLNNREPVLEMLARFTEDLTALQRNIRWGDGEALFDLFTRTRDIRRDVIDAGQEIDEPDFGRWHGPVGVGEAEKKTQD
ncbi:Cyclohexadienyl dehydrogenase [hydrothermal vent metagenome]|uniref:Cyclohexadienyl dehydrogenase n=1 Tax=hydrothermal vent metagenome TaxID=652676 RepID=A0A3B0TJB1_9ZZZZ